MAFFLGSVIVRARYRLGGTARNGCFMDLDRITPLQYWPDSLRAESINALSVALYLSSQCAQT
ncbi:hypothetical protein A6E19_05620 [Pseudomonas putida]|nr:hypothetical protein A6E23_21925 [Pseudomonas putida]OCT22680.1 hypothetical protein A6E20_15060 [Pseudomonas putida]OCT37394.1 hypothetical protein A6E24_20165 [Pseudomonas putida]OCT40848.1 hypothetical protein A6E19_05620 [Pseudomonas putida]